MNDRYLKLKDAVNVVRNTVAEGTLESTLELRLLDKSLTADVRENVRGEWIRRDDGWDGDYYECSVCKEPFTLIDGTPQDNLYNFCPNCGADMRQVTGKLENNDNPTHTTC